MRLSLRALTIGFLLMFGVATVGSGAALFFLTQRTIERLAEQRIESVSLSLAPDGLVTPRRQLLADLDALARRRDTGDLGTALVASDGRQIGGNVHLRRVLPLGFSAVGRSDGIVGLTHGRALVRRVGTDRLAILVETEPFDDYANARLWIYISAFGIITIIVLAGLIAFRRQIGGRILAMRRTVDAIIDGNLDQRVPLTGSGDEFDEQAQGFNRMLDRMAELMGEIRSVTNDIAHDLRTPLSRLRQRLSGLHAHVGGRTADEIAAAIAETDRLLGTFTAMLRIAEIDGGRRRAGFAPVRVDAILVDCVDMLAAVAEDGLHPLSIGSAEPAIVLGDASLLRQLLVNLIENALRHTPSGTRISVSLAVEAGAARLMVEDNGPGVGKEQRATVLRRFARGSGTAEGHGLGLALVAAIVRLHAGALRLDDAQPGLRVVVSLPLV